MTNVVLPQHSWHSCERFLQAVAENEVVEVPSLGFLVACGLVTITGKTAKLSHMGQEYYDARFIRNDHTIAISTLRRSLLCHPAVQAIIQLLHGVKDAHRSNVLSILKSRGIWIYPDERMLTNLLLVMNTAGLITYSKKHGSVRILHNPSEDDGVIPTNVFIDPKHPYSNKLMLKKILSSCEGVIFWIDKHFTAAGLEFIWEIADANRIREISILSLSLPEMLGKKSITSYRDLKAELSSKGITLTWFVIDSTHIRDNHDRWILTNSKAWNLPDINTILSGSRSEISESPNGPEMIKAFKSYLENATEIGNN